MNQKQLNDYRKKIWHKFHIPNTGRLNKRKINVVVLHSTNGLPHELKKAEICYILQKAKMKYITEAQSCADSRIIDIVCLDTGTEIEVIDTSLTNKTKEAMRKGNIPILAIKVDEEFNIDMLLKRELT